MASKKLTWKNFVIVHPEALFQDVMLDEEIFGVPSIRVKRTLGFQEMAEFVADVVTTCVDNDEVAYLPELFDFAVRLGVMSRYADVQMPTGRDSVVEHATELAYRILYETDLYEHVIVCIDQEQLQTMIGAAKEKIQYMRDLQVSAAAQKATELIAKIDDMMNESKAVLDQVDGENFAKALENMAQSGFFGAYAADTNAHAGEPTADSATGGNVVVMKKRGGMEL